MPGVRDSTAERLYDRLPTWLLSRPEAGLLAFMCLLSGVPSAAGVVRPHSLEVMMPPWLVRCWGLVLVVGAVASIVGLTSIREEGGKEVLHRAAPYKLGMRMLSLGSAVYAFAVMYVAGLQGLGAAPIILGFAAACWLRLLGLRVWEIRSRGVRGYQRKGEA